MLRPAYLSQKLDRPLPTKDGGTLRTIREACDYTTAMDKQRELRQRWQRIAKLILAKENVLTVYQGARTCPVHGCQARRGESLGKMKAPASPEAFKEANEFGLGLDVA
jgi:hypothetical protein